MIFPDGINWRYLPDRDEYAISMGNILIFVRAESLQNGGEYRAIPTNNIRLADGKVVEDKEKTRRTLCSENLWK